MKRTGESASQGEELPLAMLDDALLSDARSRPSVPAMTAANRLIWWVGLAAVPAFSQAVAGLLLLQGSAAIAAIVSGCGALATLAWLWWGIFRTASLVPGWSVAVLMALFVLAAVIGEVGLRFGNSWSGILLAAIPAAGSVWWTYRQLASQPKHRTAATTLVTALAAGIVIWLMHRAEWRQPAIAALGLIALGTLLVLGQALLRGVLDYPHGIAGVARTVIDEAARTKATLVLVVFLLVMLPALPLVLDPDERLAYRIQFFLEWALGGGVFLLAMMTIFLVCGSVCGDIDTRRIHMTLAKPLARWEYLLGKWVGVTLFNLLLVMIVGVGAYTAAMLLQATPATDAADRLAVDEQVLTARQEVRPTHPREEEFDRTIIAEIDRMKAEEPEAFAKGEELARERIRGQYIQSWHNVYPDVVSSYLFQGLRDARDRSRSIQLRLKPFADNVNIDRADVRFVLWLNERPYPSRNGVHEEFTIMSGTFHTLDLPAEAIDDEGRLLVTIANRNLVPAGETRATAISFMPGSGLQLLYPVGSFEANLLRAMIIAWAKLAMIAAAALAASSWLGFPVAVLTGLMIYAVAAANAFLADSMDYYTGVGSPNAGVVDLFLDRLFFFTRAIAQFKVWTACKVILASIGELVVMLVPSFGTDHAVSHVATGRVVTMGELTWCLAQVGFLGSSILGAIAALIFQRRDLTKSDA